MKSWFAQHPRAVQWGLASVVFVVAVLLMYWRYPLAFSRPNFYAEDGDVFVATLRQHGLLQALATSFNGYYLAGLYLLTQLALVIDQLFYHGQFVEIPKSLALVSYGFFAGLAALPMLLFRKWLSYPALVALALLTCFVPLREWDYAIIGTVGNLKFGFMYLAFLLVVYQLWGKPGWRGIVLADIGILLCGYTNLTVYVFLPIMAGVYGWRWWAERRRNARAHSGWLKRPEILGLMVLSGFLAVQLLMIKLHGVPAMPGYLDTPFPLERSVEVMGARTFLYSWVFWVYQSLNDFIVAGLCLAGAVAAWWLGLRERRPFYLAAVVAIGATTLLTVTNRTGIGGFFTGYHDVGPEQFFYAQNLMASFLGVVVVYDIGRRFLRPYQRWMGSILFLVGFGFTLPLTGSFGRHQTMQDNVGTIEQNAERLCTQNGAAELKLPVYPANLKPLDVTRIDLCR